jgi:hypothetical protein
MHCCKGMASITVAVKTLDGHSLHVDVPLSGTVKDVRTQLKQQYGLAKCGLYLQVRNRCFRAHVWSQ